MIDSFLSLGDSGDEDDSQEESGEDDNEEEEEEEGEDEDDGDVEMEEEEEEETPKKKKMAKSSGAASSKGKVSKGRVQKKQKPKTKTAVKKMAGKKAVTKKAFSGQPLVKQYCRKSSNQNVVLYKGLLGDSTDKDRQYNVQLSQWKKNQQYYFSIWKNGTGGITLSVENFSFLKKAVQDVCDNFGQLIGVD